MTRKLWRIALLLCLLVLTTMPAYSAADVAGEARNLLNQLNPIYAALGPLEDNAIAKGNDALAQRLEQLRNIIQEALFNLNKIITDSTVRINADAEGRLNQLNRQVGDNLELLNAIASGQVDKIDDHMQQRIDQIKNATNQLVQALPIPAQPLPDVPKTGFSLIRPSATSTTLFVTGAGLRKGGVAPRAFLLNNDSSDRHALSHNGTELKVKAASMGLVEIEIPAALFPSNGQSEKTLVLMLRAGNILPGKVEPSFPLLLCSRLPQYATKITVEPIGQFWETRTVDYPSYNVPANKEYYIDDNGSNNAYNICASDADADNWTVDPSVNNPPDPNRPHGPGIIYGLEFLGTEEHIGATIMNNPHNGCIRLYAGKDSSGGGHAKAWGLRVHQRRLKSGSCSAPLVVSQSILKFGPNAIETHPQEALGRCVATTAGASESPVLRTNVAVTEDDRQPPEQANLVRSTPAHLLDGSITATMDQFGLIKIDVSAKCGRQINYYGGK